jgi:flavin reductase (DIM6/NTAB) family NADH-FMN oxidoreductase RutF
VFDPRAFRDVLGNFVTGVTIVTANDDGEMVGVAANSFTSVSLDPPLISFCAAHSSTTYPRIRRAAHFCVNVLAEGQHETAQLFAQRGADRFAKVGWRPSPLGAAILDGVLAWVDCTLEAEHRAGDHDIVLGRVVDFAVDTGRRPLLFFRGRFAVARPEIEFL